MIVFIIITFSVLLIVFSTRLLKFDTSIQNMLPQDEKLKRTIALTASSSVSDKVLLYIHVHDENLIDKAIEDTNRLIAESPVLKDSLPTADDILEIHSYLEKNALLLYPYKDMDDPFTKEQLQKRFAAKYQYLLNMPFDQLGEGFFSDPLNQSVDLLKLQFSSKKYLSVYKGGILSNDKKSFLRVFTTGFYADNTEKSKPLQDLDMQLTKMAEKGGYESFLYSAHLYFLESSTTMQNEVSVIFLVSILLTIFVFFFFFHNLEVIIYCFMPIVAGVALTFLVILFFLGKFGAIALAFGATTAGICIDYSIHYLFKVEFHLTLKELRQHIGKSLFMGYFTTLLAFVMLSFSGIDSLKEISLFGSLVITFSFLFNWCILQNLVKPGIHSYRVRSFDFSRWNVSKGRTLFVVVLLIFFAFSCFTQLETDSSSLDIPHKRLDLRGERIQKEFGESSNNVFIGFVGETESEAIEQSMKATIKLAQQEPALLFLNPAVFVPTQRILEDREKYIREHLDFGQFQLAVKQSEFTEEAFLPFYNILETVMNGEFRIEEVPAYLMEGMKESIVVYEGKYYFVVHIGDREKAKVIHEKLDQYGVNYVSMDIVNDSIEGLLSFEKRSLLLILASIFVIFFTLLIAFRKVKIAFSSILPIISGLIGLFGINAILGIPINIMHITASILIVGIGVDYGIYTSAAWARLEKEKESGDIQEVIKNQNRTIQSILVAALTTLAGFGVLGFSSSGALFSLGVSMTLGILFAFFTASLIVPLFFEGPRKRKLKLES